MIVIVDYGMGNFGSIVNMVRKVGGRAVLSADAREIADAEKLILPGVGAFDNGMKCLRDLGCIDVLTARVLNDRAPILGICLGMQLFARRSEEGPEPGLGWIDADVVRFTFDPSNRRLKIPNMGWNTIAVKRPHPLLPDTEAARRFYFVHSYHLRCSDPLNVLATSWYGVEFTSAVVKDNIVGTQFHPEKSHKYGMELMRHFVHDM